MRVSRGADSSRALNSASDKHPGGWLLKTVSELRTAQSDKLEARVTVHGGKHKAVEDRPMPITAVTSQNGRGPWRSEKTVVQMMHNVANTSQTPHASVSDKRRRAWDLLCVVTWGLLLQLRIASSSRRTDSPQEGDMAGRLQNDGE